MTIEDITKRFCRDLETAIRADVEAKICSMCHGPEEVIAARLQLMPVGLCASCAKLGDQYRADIEAAARKPLQEKIDRICELLAAHGCDCDWGHQLEEHDDDRDPCLACRIDAVVSGR